MIGVDVGAGCESATRTSSLSAKETERRAELVRESFRSAECRFFALSTGVWRSVGVETFCETDPLRMVGALLVGIGVLWGTSPVDCVDS
jgi:hypothetical protein